MTMHFFRILLFVILPQFAQAEYVRVRVATVAPDGIEISGSKLHFQGQVSPYKKISNILSTSETAKIDFVSLFGSQWKLEQNNLQKTIEAPFLKVEGKALKVNHFSTPSQLMLWPRDNGQVDVIAVLELEKYLEGVLPHEMPASWPEEALKAQVIASRSYALSQLDLKEKKPYQLDSTTRDQVYKFADASLDAHYQAKIARIVSETKGLVLKDVNGKVVHAYYHSDCGGRTESAQVVWDSDTDTSRVTDDQCGVAETSNWIYEIKAKEVERKLSISDLKDLRIFSRSTSGRVQLLSADGVLISGQDFREKLGYSKIKSTLFDLTLKTDRFVFKGKGFGHGVGLCQHGARALATAGKNHVEILKHYFPMAAIK